MILSSKNFTRIQRFIYKELLTQHDFTCPEGMTFDDVGKQCFPVACYGAMCMHHKFGITSPLVIVGDMLLHDGNSKVRGEPHAMVFFGGYYIDFTDLTRNIQYPENEVVWGLDAAYQSIENGADQVLAWLRVDSIYGIDAFGELYSGALRDIISWRPSKTPTNNKPRKLKLSLGNYTGSLGNPPDIKTIKKIGYKEWQSQDTLVVDHQQDSVPQDLTDSSLAKS